MAKQAYNLNYTAKRNLLWSSRRSHTRHRDSYHHPTIQEEAQWWQSMVGNPFSALWWCVWASEIPRKYPKMIPAGIIPRFARTQFRVFHSHSEFHILTSHYQCLQIYNDFYCTSFQIVNVKSPGKTHSGCVHLYHHNNFEPAFMEISYRSASSCVYQNQFILVDFALDSCCIIFDC